jgi:hypothetical protein
MNTARHYTFVALLVAAAWLTAGTFLIGLWCLILAVTGRADRSPDLSRGTEEGMWGDDDTDAAHADWRMWAEQGRNQSQRRHPSNWHPNQDDAA